VAKKTTRRAGGPGGGSRDDQIRKLAERIGTKGVKQAEAWVADKALHDVIRYAFKTLPKASPGVGGLGKRIETLLAGIPEAERANMRAALLASKRGLGD